jgi:hypothetical protein
MRKAIHFAIVVLRTVRKHAVCRMMIVQGDANLMQIVFATGAARGFAGGLHGRQKERDQDADDGDDDQKFDQRKAANCRSAEPRPTN